MLSSRVGLWHLNMHERKSCTASAQAAGPITRSITRSRSLLWSHIIRYNKRRFTYVSDGQTRNTDARSDVEDYELSCDTGTWPSRWNDRVTRKFNTYPSRWLRGGDCLSVLMKLSKTWPSSEKYDVRLLGLSLGSREMWKCMVAFDWKEVPMESRVIDGSLLISLPPTKNYASQYCW